MYIIYLIKILSIIGISSLSNAQALQADTNTFEKGNSTSHNENKFNKDIKKNSLSSAIRRPNKD